MKPQVTNVWHRGDREAGVEHVAVDGRLVGELRRRRREEDADVELGDRDVEAEVGVALQRRFARSRGDGGADRQLVGLDADAVDRHAARLQPAHERVDGASPSAPGNSRS